MEKNIHTRLFTSALSIGENRLLHVSADLPNQKEVDRVVQEAAAVEALVKATPTLDQSTKVKLLSVRSELDRLQRRFTVNNGFEHPLHVALLKSENALDNAQKEHVQAEKNFTEEKAENARRLQTITATSRDKKISWAEWGTRDAVPEINRQHDIIKKLVAERPYNMESRIKEATEQIARISALDLDQAGKHRSATLVDAISAAIVAKAHGGGRLGDGFMKVPDVIPPRPPHSFEPLDPFPAGVTRLSPAENERIDSLSKAIINGKIEDQNTAINYWNGRGLSASVLKEKAKQITAELDKKDPVNPAEVIFKNGNLEVQERPRPLYDPSPEEKKGLERLFQMVIDFLKALVDSGVENGDISFMKMKVLMLTKEINELRASSDYKDPKSSRNSEVMKQVKELEDKKKTLQDNIEEARKKAEKTCEQLKTECNRTPNCCVTPSVNQNGAICFSAKPGAVPAVAFSELTYLYKKCPAGTAEAPTLTQPLVINRYDNSFRVTIGDNNTINVGKGNVVGGSKGSDAYSPNRIYRDSANSGPNIGPYARGGRTYNSMGRTYGFKTPPGSGAHNAGHNA